MDDRSEQRRSWAASGAMALTGHAGGPPLVAPDGVVDRMRALGAPLEVEVLPLLSERAAVAGLWRRGSTSCGGSSRLLPTANGWIAVSLPRDDDVALVPAWLGLNGPTSDDPWADVARAVRSRSGDELAALGGELGLAVAAVPTVVPTPAGPVGGPRSAGADPFEGLPVRATAAAGRPAAPRPVPLVVDLSSLWAGPLCSRLLASRGMRSVKVESWRRPDGARRGPRAFFDLLHGGREAVALDLPSAAGVARLRRLLAAADVVVEASRPRALEQLGIDAAAVVADGGPSVWLSITGHGRHGDRRNRTAFGDDAAAGGGLVARDELGPCFVADAVADPLAGVAAAAAAVAALDAGGAWLIDVAMSGVAAHVAAGGAGGRWEPGTDAEAQPPAPPPAPSPPGPALGEHTDAVLAELGCR